MKQTFQMEGAQELNALFEDMQNDFGIKDQKNILTNAARASMKPVMETAKALVAVDTGALKTTIKVSAKKPSAKDRRSKYVNAGDVAIGVVSAYIKGSALAKMKYTNAKTGAKVTGIDSDARATVQEFGSYKMPAKPYLRPALESKGQQVVNELGQTIGSALEKYKSKHKGK
jgi:HK97 gp10 family phage protein